MPPESGSQAPPPLRGPDVTGFRLPLDCHRHRPYTSVPHREAGYTEVRMAIRGRGELQLGDQVFPVRRGDVVVIPTRLLHGCVCQTLELYDIVVHDAFLQRHAAALDTLPGFALWFRVAPFFAVHAGVRHGLTLDPQEHRRMVGLFQLLEEELNRSPAPAPTGAEALTLFILARLCHLYACQLPDLAGAESVHRPTLALQHALNLIHQSYAERLTLQDLATAAHMERSYFGRLFRRSLGLTPMQYLNRHRVHMACRLLQETTLKVLEIGPALGFHDGSHFSRVFSQMMGMSPAVYRESLQIVNERDAEWIVEPAAGE